MRIFKLALAAATLSLSTVAVAVAGVGLNLRQSNEQRQIDAGKRSGKLSRGERDALTSEQHMIKRTQDRLKARHGKLTASDKARVKAMLDRSQRHIERLKHNRRRGRHGVHI